MSADNGANRASEDAAQGSNPTGAAVLCAGTTHDRRDTPGTILGLPAGFATICITAARFSNHCLEFRLCMKFHIRGLQLPEAIPQPLF